MAKTLPVDGDLKYQKVLDFMLKQLPIFSRVGPAAYNKSLDNIKALCAHLGNPETKFDSIHVAGTNGKGSTSSLIASTLIQAGYKTGLTTSPHFLDFRERIRVDGEMIDKQSVVTFFEEARLVIEACKPSFFEMSVALAFWHFAQSKVEIAVVEVGLGGRLDSTNILFPLLSVITNVGMDHMALLGDTVAAIAEEKAGIIKPGIPIVLGESEPEVLKVVSRVAAEVSAELVEAEKELTLELQALTHFDQTFKAYVGGQVVLDNLVVGLPGVYQRHNVRTALLAISELQQLGYPVSEEDIRDGFQHVKQVTGIRGRWEVLATRPLTIAESAHNEPGLREAMQQLSLTPHHQLHLVFGVVSDKDLTAIMPLLPKQASYYWCAPDMPRALAADNLKDLALTLELGGQAFKSVKDAIKSAQEYAKKDEDVIYIGGSMFVVAEALALFE